ncbi:hypothetical protein C4D60_Mb07t28600 [Musa balbisiana]|uniref:Uncharacterized protein n=1 Tax=Musa balbisiana TaxID=52838 RepID=A0A4V4H709_MUSBA|nr:hypothetical protein C4D60_Mb07t28600 [Musa balbisiana]
MTTRVMRRLGWLPFLYGKKIPPSATLPNLLRLPFDLHPTVQYSSHPFFPLSQRGMSQGDQIFLPYIYENPQVGRASAAAPLLCCCCLRFPPPRSLHPRGCGKMKRKGLDSKLCRGGSRKKRAGRSCHRKFLQRS